MPCKGGYKKNHNPFTDTSSAQIRGTENMAKRGGYGMDGTPGTSIPGDHGQGAQGVTAGMKSAPSSVSGDERGRKMPPRKGGNAAAMVMRIAHGSQT